MSAAILRFVSVRIVFGETSTHSLLQSLLSALQLCAQKAHDKPFQNLMCRKYTQRVLIQNRLKAWLTCNRRRGACPRRQRTLKVTVRAALCQRATLPSKLVRKDTGTCRFARAHARTNNWLCSVSGFYMDLFGLDTPLRNDARHGLAADLKSPKVSRDECPQYTSPAAERGSGGGATGDIVTCVARV